MPDLRAIEFMARSMVHDLSERVHRLETYPAFRQRRLAFNTISDHVLSALVTLMAPPPTSFVERQHYLQELVAARGSLTALRKDLLRAADRGWLARVEAEQLTETSDELAALLVLLSSALRREREWKAG